MYEFLVFWKMCSDSQSERKAEINLFSVEIFPVFIIFTAGIIITVWIVLLIIIAEAQKYREYLI